MFPNAIAANVGCRIRVFEYYTSQGIEVVAIQLGVTEGLGALLDQGVEIDILLQIEEVLAVLFVEAKELPTNRAQEFLQYRLNKCAEEAGVLFGNGQHKTEIISQLLRRRSDWRINIRRR